MILFQTSNNIQDCKCMIVALHTNLAINCPGGLENIPILNESIGHSLNVSQACGFLLELYRQCDGFHHRLPFLESSHYQMVFFCLSPKVVLISPTPNSNVFMSFLHSHSLLLYLYFRYLYVFFFAIYW